MSGASSAIQVFDSGLVVGHDGGIIDGQPFIWEGGSIAFLGEQPGAVVSRPIAAAKDGRVIVGVSGVNAGSSFPRSRAMKWVDGVYTFLPTLPNTFTSHAADAAEDSDVIIGTIRFNAKVGQLDVGVLWLGDEVFEINDLLITDDASLHVTGAIECGADGTILVDGIGESGTAFILRPALQSSGDLNGDCRTNIHDLIQLLQRWGSDDDAADLNSDNVVNVFDLLFLLHYWTG